MSSRRSSVRRSRKEKPAFERFKSHCRHFTAFMFSNVGIILLVTFYTIGGAFIFQAIEIFEYERLKLEKPQLFTEKNFSGDCLTRIWQLTAENISFYDRQAYRNMVSDVLLKYQQDIFNKTLQRPQVEQWSFSGAFLYSLTVITTIGYGNITPHSEWGKLVTILYAIIGMPLFLLYLSNIGDVLAKSFKWIYSKVCLCRICPGVAKRRIIRERSKIRQLVTASEMLPSVRCKLLTKINIPSARVLLTAAEKKNSKSKNAPDVPTNDQFLKNGAPIKLKHSLEMHSLYAHVFRVTVLFVLINAFMETSYMHEMESARRSYSTSTSSTTNSSSDYTKSSLEALSVLDLSLSEPDSDIERELRGSTDEITVPVTVCIFVMVSYILWGAFLFGRWEEWNYLDGSYFCFISLSSIGFGDLVPGDKVITADKNKVEVSFILCAVYLLLGMALIAMCFNLMQEEVVHNIRAIKRGFKSCFRCQAS